MALQKLQYFFTNVMGPYHFFDGFGPIFFCSVNAPYGSAETPVFLYKSYGSVLLFWRVRAHFFL